MKRKNPLIDLYEEIVEEKIREFQDPEESIRENWENLPTNLRDELIALGFKVKKK
ncbi:hypothetical protein KY331_02740 [Candidatus Woesearchaeota archaeon]|nr:hypothetical protein [Candidatus Woesearchaeota archaeon]